MNDALRQRSDRCELCESELELAALAVPPGEGVDRSVLACAACRERIAESELDPRHWFCLQGSVWSEIPAVKVLSWRLLQRLVPETWAVDLLEQVYLDDEERAWAEATMTDGPSDEVAPTLDSNGTVLAEGDSVTLIKDLPVKGANFTAKRGTLVKKIHLCEDPGLVEGRVNKVSIFLKTEFLRKA